MTVSVNLLMEADTLIVSVNRRLMEAVALIVSVNLLMEADTLTVSINRRLTEAVV